MESQWPDIVKWATARCKQNLDFDELTAEEQVILSLIPAAINSWKGSNEELNLEIFSCNWISPLNELASRITRNSSALAYTDEQHVIPADEDRTQGMHRFSSTVRYDGLVEPSPELGFINGKPPQFARKKDARQYASYCMLHRLLKKYPQKFNRSLIAQLESFPIAPSKSKAKPVAARASEVPGTTAPVAPVDDSQTQGVPPSFEALRQANPTNTANILDSFIAEQSESAQDTKHTPHHDPVSIPSVGPMEKSPQSSVKPVSSSDPSNRRNSSSNTSRRSAPRSSNLSMGAGELVGQRRELSRIFTELGIEKPICRIEVCQENGRRTYRGWWEKKVGTHCQLPNIEVEGMYDRAALEHRLHDELIEALTRRAEHWKFQKVKDLEGVWGPV